MWSMRRRLNLHSIIRESAPALEPIVRWGLSFYDKDGKDICYIKPNDDFIAFGFGESVNPAHEEGAHMHPVAWNVMSLDAATEARIRALVEKAAPRDRSQSGTLVKLRTGNGC
jgi:hypothetical protein